ncbi:MAG: hypothetical protein QOD30_503, partial [Actinomycetota bacterium]|nr:hypothetical protein [Actinomycetota bacterium]
TPLLALALTAAGAASWLVWEPNKRAWTPTFALLVAAGFAAVLVCRIELPVLGAIGRNALLVYLGQHVLREIWLAPTTYLHVGPPPHGLLEYAAIAAVGWWAAALLLGRIGVRLRV